MFDDHHGFYIQRIKSGGVRIVKREDATAGSKIIFETTLTAAQWSRAVAAVAKDCETCRAFYMAYAGHMGEHAEPAEEDIEEILRKHNEG